MNEWQYEDLRDQIEDLERRIGEYAAALESRESASLRKHKIAESILGQVAFWGSVYGLNYFISGSLPVWLSGAISLVGGFIIAQGLVYSPYAKSNSPEVLWWRGL